MNNQKTTSYLTTALIVVGFLLIALAWNGAASELLVDKQIPYLVSGGLTGVGMIIAGCTLALIQELRKSTGELAARLEALAHARAEDSASDAMADTLPEPRTTTGSTIQRESTEVISS